MNFFVELLFFKKPGRDSGSGGKKGNPGRMTWEKMDKKKKCVVEIKNKDDFCCARAIVAMKGREDNDPHCKHLRLGRPFQKNWLRSFIMTRVCPKVLVVERIMSELCKVGDS